MSPDRVLRGAAAAVANAAPLTIELGRRPHVPEELLAEARGAARAEGYAAGWAHGRRDAARQVRDDAERAAQAAREAAAAQAAAVDRALAALSRAAAALEQRTTPVLAEAEDAIIDAAFRLAETIVGRELRTADEPGRDAVRRALAQLPGAAPVTVRLHPDDHAELTGAESAATGELVLDGRSVTLVADPTLTPGDATAESGATQVDARITSALARAREVLQ